jgi:phospholipase C
MTFCGSIVRFVDKLEREAQILVNKVCEFKLLANCADFGEEQYQQCSKSEDDGYNECTQTKDEGYNECCDWWPCSWACDAWVWVSNIVCIAWTWISHVVCVAWTTVVKWVCRVLYWILVTVCKLVVSIIFVLVRKVFIQIILLPCSFHHPKLDKRIKHIFVLVLENRSFDHMLGAIPIRGTDADTGVATQTNRRSDKAYNDVVNADGSTSRYYVGTGQARSVGIDPGHEFGDTLVGLGGKGATYPPYPTAVNTGFAQEFALKSSTPGTIMLSYTEDDVPVIAQLAREFLVCDNWFSSMPGPTWPNRLFYHAASSAGMDDSPSTGDTITEELVEGVIFDNGTIYDLLDSENIDWAVYHGDDLPQVMALAGMDLATIAEHYHGMDDFAGDLARGDVANYVFIEPDYGDDITGNTYRCGTSQHPLDDITHGERLIKQVYEAIRNSPLWEQSLLIIAYDEGGGFYDHVEPGTTAAPGDGVTDPDDDFHNFDFTQLGVRIPAVICSPWIPRNLIDHRVYEHASVPSTVEKLWSLPHMTDRDAHARDLASLLTLAAPRTDAPTTLVDPAQSEADCGGADARTAVPVSRRRKATLIDRDVLAVARVENPEPITSSSAGFLRLALKRDVMHAPRTERARIVAQARRFSTMGEVAVYGRLVLAEIARAEAMADRPVQASTGRPVS